MEYRISSFYLMILQAQMEAHVGELVQEVPALEETFSDEISTFSRTIESLKTQTSIEYSKVLLDPSDLATMEYSQILLNPLDSVTRQLANIYRMVILEWSKLYQNNQQQECHEKFSEIVAYLAEMLMNPQEKVNKIILRNDDLLVYDPELRAICQYLFSRIVQMKSPLNCKEFSCCLYDCYQLFEFELRKKGLNKKLGVSTESKFRKVLCSVLQDFSNYELSRICHIVYLPEITHLKLAFDSMLDITLKPGQGHAQPYIEESFSSLMMQLQNAIGTVYEDRFYLEKTCYQGKYLNPSNLLSYKREASKKGEKTQFLIRNLPKWSLLAKQGKRALEQEKENQNQKGMGSTKTATIEQEEFPMEKVIQSMMPQLDLEKFIDNLLGYYLTKRSVIYSVYPGLIFRDKNPEQQQANDLERDKKLFEKGIISFLGEDSKQIESLEHVYNRLMEIHSFIEFCMLFAFNLGSDNCQYLSGEWYTRDDIIEVCELLYQALLPFEEAVIRLNVSAIWKQRELTDQERMKIASREVLENKIDREYRRKVEEMANYTFSTKTANRIREKVFEFVRSQQGESSNLKQKILQILSQSRSKKRKRDNKKEFSDYCATGSIAMRLVIS